MFFKKKNKEKENKDMGKYKSDKYEKRKWSRDAKLILINKVESGKEKRQ